MMRRGVGHATYPERISVGPYTLHIDRFSGPLPIPKST